MVAMSLRAGQGLNVAIRTLCVGLAGWVAPFLFFFSLSLLVRNASGEIWGLPLVNWATPSLLGFGSGFLAGAVLGLVLGPKARVGALGAGLLQLVLLMSSGFYLETFIAALAIGAGLILGAHAASAQRRA
jgi:hypothetical protein